MVDFPEGYGFGPRQKYKAMQSSFTVDIGVFTHMGKDGLDFRRHARRRGSPYYFDRIGSITKVPHEATVRGMLDGMQAPIEGPLQQVVTALCTLHRMKGGPQ